MTKRLRKLNDEGMRRFAEYLAAGASGDAPLSLLDNPETSDQLVPAVLVSEKVFDSRYELGVYLNSILGAFDAAVISGDRNLWTSLALLWFEQICPKGSDGLRDVMEEYRYILSGDYRHYYRHLVRSPWYLVRQHGENARFLLVASKQNNHPLSVHGEILEQVGGRQQVLASKPIIAAANKLYLDPSTGRPRKGVAGRGRGSAHRFGMVLRQLALTYDPEIMSDEGLITILPDEFGGWKRHLTRTAGQRSGAVSDASGEARARS
ncbi:hypothetical protein [Bradyrhizobium sp. CER78]|uniref:hypothetical protein n=1 Tax=Bradyrhizobium sp. CER78 TaxID=3039162 RepID=UPI00244C36BE|nr:hypothetical protein [Bradyrhizobium sp. CER78]MDH2382842.1 hypothetical protein [Bradyrhizobium sp. CER78]